MKLIYPEGFPEEARTVLEHSLQLALQGSQQAMILPIGVFIQGD